jgi:DNA-binding NarL/FixJ family response regulator
MLVDRKVECAAIDHLLGGVRSGSSGVLVLRGAPGIGKSALVDYAVSKASDLAVSRVTGVESEIVLGFAAVHQLLLPFFDHLADLPAPQRHALESVFGLADHGAPDSLLVFLAVLTVLDNAARERPVLLAIDDVQWLDDDSARVLTFVARRLHADPIAMVFAGRDTSVDALQLLRTLPQLEVNGLPEDDSRALLEHAAGRPIDAAVAGRLFEQTQGNPLALVEIVAALRDEQLGGDVPLPDPLPIGRSLADEFAARARSLSRSAQTLLLLASAERMGDLAVLHRAAIAAGVPWEEAVANIEAAGLASFAPAATFRHPLIRSAVYHSASAAERRRAHRALADSLQDEDDSDRRAAHLAAAAAAPDEDIARALQEAAERVFHRGGTQAAAQFLMRASELTPDPVRRIDRLLEAVRLRSAEGDAARAQPLLDAVMSHVHDARQRAVAEWTQGLIWLGAGQGRDALHVLARAVASIERYDSGFPLDALITAEDAVLYAGSLAEGSLAHDISTAARRLLPRSAVTPTEQLVGGIGTCLTEGHVAAASTLRAALAGLREQAEDAGVVVTPNAHDRAHVLHLLAVNAAAAVLDDAALETVTRSWVELGRRTRTLNTLPIALDVRSVSEIFAGRFRAAAAAIAEAEDVLSLVGARGHIGQPGLGQLLLYAYSGDEENTRAAAARRAQDAHERGSGIDLDHSDYALAMLELGSGGYAMVLEHCRAIDARDPVTFSMLALPLLIEAAVRCDELAIADAALDRFSDRATASGSDWALGLLSCMRALFATGDDAEKHYRVSLDHLSRCTAAFDVARARLLYGEWLRRQRRRRDARQHLRAAFESFERMGANAFAERAGRELTATGEHSRPRTDATRNVLTAQEAHIARLVADGKTNADIASQLFISRSTVEYHLRKIYRKLGVNTRTQLARYELRR